MKTLREMMNAAASTFALSTALALIAAPTAALAQASGVTDPGVRSGTPLLFPLKGLNAFSTNDLTTAEADVQSAIPGFFSINPTGPGEIEMFNAGANFFTETVSVLPPGTPGHIDDAPTGDVDGGGLGPSFNENSCLVCHAFPIEGGSSGTINPQVKIATLDGAKNTVPPFISSTGPIREARFINNNGVPDGGVHGLFVIAGRSDAAGCTATQVNWPQQVAANNVIFRIPINVFGDGLVEGTSDETFISNAASVQTVGADIGISTGVFNHNGNTGTIAHFGWKAQNVSLLLFAGEAYNVEQGVTNDLFPAERVTTADCQFNQLPEDSEVLLTTTPTTPSGFAFADLASDITQFAFFARLVSEPIPALPSSVSEAQATTGLSEFISVGCAICHFPTQTTGSSIYTAQSSVTYAPFSDFGLHDMGTGLADHVSQGQANGLQFRTAPLWGVGQRTFFLHDGRTSNIITAIEDHASSGSEANVVISGFNKLSATNQQDIVDFLRSL